MLLCRCNSKCNSSICKDYTFGKFVFSGKRLLATTSSYNSSDRSLDLESPSFICLQKSGCKNALTILSNIAKQRIPSVLKAHAHQSVLSLLLRTHKNFPISDHDARRSRLAVPAKVVSGAGSANSCEASAPSLKPAKKTRGYPEIKADRFSTKFEIVEGAKIFILSHQGSQIYILGTNHVDQRHVQMVQSLLKGLKPDVVGVELCRTRAGHKHQVAGADEHSASGSQSEFHFQLIPPEWTRAAVGEKLGLLYVYGAINYAESKAFRVKLQRYQQLRTYKLRPPIRVDNNMVIGAELLAPFRNLIWRSDSPNSNYLSNSSTHYKILLLDRPVQVTYALLAEAMTEEQKQLVRDYKHNFEHEFISYKKQNRETIIATLLLNRHSQLYEIFVDQRDVYMAQMMFTALVNDGTRKLFCVIGRTHVNGVMVKLKQLFGAKIAEGRLG